MRKSDCILNEGQTSNSFNLEGERGDLTGSKMKKGNKKKKGNSESPLKSSMKQHEGKESEVFRRSSSQQQIITNDKESRKKNARSQFEQKLERHAQ